MVPGKQGRPRHEAGFTYVAMLFALAIFGIGLAAIGELWSTVSRRAKEAELVVIGGEYARAIGRYYERSPGSPKQYPVKLEDLVEDPRFLGVERHIRRLYRDPIRASQEWGLVHNASGAIVGVFSVSDRDTMQKVALNISGAQPVSGDRYSDWKFVYKAKP